jgi:hypothetical protein
MYLYKRKILYSIASYLYKREILMHRLRLLKNISTKTIILLICIGFIGNSLSAATVKYFYTKKHTVNFSHIVKSNPAIEKNISTPTSTAINESESSRNNERAPFDSDINYSFYKTNNSSSILKNHPIKRLLQRSDEVKGFFVNRRLE